MGAIVWRELIAIARTPAVTVVVCTYIGLLAGFALVWHNGVPVLGGANVYEQQHLFQWVLLAVLLPWASVRLLVPDCGRHMVLLCMLIAHRPSTVVIAKVVALIAVLSLVIVAGLPAAIVAQQMSAVPMWVPIRDLGSLLGLAALAAAGAMTWILVVRGRLLAWIGASASTTLVLVVLSRWPPAGLPMGWSALLVGAALTVATAGWSDSAYQYDAE